MLRIFVLLSLICLSQAVAKNARHFSLFSVVTFKNEACTTVSNSAITGTCMTTSECTNAGGVGDGNCASGFGTCCLFRLSTCGGSATRNCTYIENVGYPTASTSATECSFTVTECQNEICQIRLDFIDATLQQPSTAGVCTNTILDITSGTTGQTFVTSPPNVCGTLTGQHMYLDSGRATTAATLKFTFATGSTLSNTWRIKVSQIGCGNPARAPPGCLQYFFGGNTNTVSSFNWDGTDAHSTGGLLQSQQYRVCFRKEKGMCGITYTTTPVATGLDAYELEATADTIAEVAVAGCTISWLKIHTPWIAATDLFCGGVFDPIDATTADSVGRTVQAFPNTGMHIDVVSIATTTISLSGFSLDAQQQACMSGYAANLAG